MARLLDADGRPVDLTALRAAQAAPSVTGVRQIIGGHPAQGLTPARLAALLREAEQGDPTRYLELAEEMEEKDLHYLAVIGTRKRAVAQLDITVDAASDGADDQANADLVRAFLDREELEDEIFDILDAVGKGFSVTEILWETSERQWMPRRLEGRLPQWFVFDRADGRTIRLLTESGAEPLAPFKFVVHTHKAKSGLPIRGGLARAAAWGYLFKNYDLKDWIAFAEVYGQPLRVGKYHPGATPADKEVLLKAVANIGSDAAAIIPQSMLIEFVESKLTGNADLYERLATYLDAQVSKAVLGQTLTTEVGDTGSFAAAKVHDSVRGDIERADAKQLAATLNRDLVRPLIELNRGPQAAYPRLKIGRSERTDVGLLAEALSKLVPLGLRVRQAEVRGKLGLDEPEAADELLTPPVSAFAPAFAPDGGAPALARARVGDESDSIAALIDGIDGWEKLLTPLVAPIEKLLGEAATLEEARDRLVEALKDMDAAELQRLLAEAGFAARLAGELGAPIQDDETPSPERSPGFAQAGNT